MDMIRYTASYTDQYQLAMAQVYFESGRKEVPAVFDYFFRKLPFDGGYAVFAGLEVLLDVLENLRFDRADLDYLREKGFSPEFIGYLETFRFRGKVYAVREGDIVFPVQPVVQVEAGIVEAQIVETLLLNFLNFQTLIATKASRMRMVAGNRLLVDFGLRRAQGPAGYYAARSAVVGGFNATSNVRAGRDFHIGVEGTMAHSFIQSHDSELAAFRDFAERRPDDCVFLVDTYDTLRSGLPNAITAGKEMEKQGHRLKGIRLDSGDLAYLARESRRMLDEGGLDYVKIAVSNQLDEFVIRSLMEQQAPIDLFGVGTSMVTGSPDAALDGVYKLSLFAGKPRIKLSETLSKVTLPHKKQVHRLQDRHGNWAGADMIALRAESGASVMYDPFEPYKSLSVQDFSREPLLEKVMERGKRLVQPRKLSEISSFSRERLELLPAEYKRFDNPHVYKVGISEHLRNERDKLVKEFRSA